MSADNITRLVVRFNFSAYLCVLLCCECILKKPDFNDKFHHGLKISDSANDTNKGTESFDTPTVVLRFTK